MNHETRKHKKLRHLIRRYEQEIENLRTLPYYRIFNRQAEQEADLRELNLKVANLKSLLTSPMNQQPTNQQQFSRLDLIYNIHDDNLWNN